MGVKNQCYATLIVCYLCLTTGSMFTWPSSVIEVFGSPNTTLNRVMTDTEISLLGSLSSVSALITLPFSGFFLDTFGRKYTCIGLSILQVIGWTIVISFNYVETILAAMFISGLSFCIYLVVPMYTGEFCQNSIRGTTTSSVVMFFVIGWLVSYILGGYLEYHMMNYVSLIMSILCTLLLFYMRESPLYLMKNGLEQEAAATIAYYRNENVSSKEVQQEMENIRRALNPELDGTTSETEKLNPSSNREKLSTWEFLKKSRSTRRGLLLSLVLYSASVFQGQVVVQMYAEPLYSEAIPNISPTVCSIIFAVVNIFAAIVVIFLVDRAGRRPLMIYSSVCTAAFALALGSQIQFHWGPHWVTAVFMYLFCITYSTGAGSIPFTVSSEIFLPEIKNFAIIVSMEYFFFGFFIILFIFNPLVSVVGLSGVFYIFSIVCILTALFCTFYMPETKGLSVDAIQHLFVKPRCHRNKV
ncbi:facilitated trehalose transporter Tret1-like [Leptidea sinapis]|uniref:facilitated trehalose transporter Tret1-like n=1 Tax=Leptidea sinapis TaxID=189913 RepID=UPI0021C4AD6E|nr:facilitated trehalose transporter Tret1-like [Leptidea sinapis]